MKIFLQVLIAAGLVWLSSEMLELVMGGRTPLTLWMTAGLSFLDGSRDLGRIRKSGQWTRYGGWRIV